MSKQVPLIQIRPMSLADLKTVMEIEPIAFGSHHWSHQSFINELNNSTGNYFVAFRKDDEQLIAYSGFWLLDDEAHITTLAVHPAFRRQHIGERLLIHDIIQAQKCGAGRLTLEVRASNEHAQNLYFKYGFKNLGARRSYYQDNAEDALVLWSGDIRTPEYKQFLRQRMREIEELQICAML